MKKMLLVFAPLIIASMILAACGTAAPTAAPTVQATSSQTPLPSDTATLVVATEEVVSLPTTFPTPIMENGSNVVVYVDQDNDDLNSLFWLLDDGSLIGGPRSEFAKRRLVSEIAGDDRKVVAVLYYDLSNDQYKVTPIDGAPELLWFSGNQVRICSNPCAQSDYLPGRFVTSVVKWYEQNDEQFVAGALSFWHVAIKELHACLASKARWGQIHYCFRDATLPMIPTITATPTFTPTITPTLTPTLPATPTRTLRPTSTATFTQAVTANPSRTTTPAE